MSKYKIIQDVTAPMRERAAMLCEGLAEEIGQMGQFVAYNRLRDAARMIRELKQEGDPPKICDHWEPKPGGHPMECVHCSYHRDAHAEHFNRGYNEWLAAHPECQF